MHKSGALFQDSCFAEAGNWMKRGLLSPATTEAPGPELCPFFLEDLRWSFSQAHCASEFSHHMLGQSSHWKGETVPQECNIQDSFDSQSLCRPCSPFENSLESAFSP